MKIYVMGLSGSGKSSLAKQLSNELSIPYLELDTVWREAGGLKTYDARTRTIPNHFRSALHQAVENTLQEPNWIIDGNYRSTVQPRLLAAADVVIFLDTPFWRRIANNLWRHIAGNDRDRGFSSRSFYTKHLPRILLQGNKRRDYYLDTVGRHPQHRILRTRNEAKELVNELSGT